MPEETTPTKSELPGQRDEERTSPRPPNPLDAELLPPARKSGRVVRREVSRRLFIGPLPPAQELQRYDKVLEGAADRILGMAESEQAHGQRMDRDVLAADREIASRGQHYALFSTLSLGAAGLVLGLTGHDWLGGVCFISALVPVVAGFLGNQASPARSEGADSKPSRSEPPEGREADDA